LAHADREAKTAGAMLVDPDVLADAMAKKVLVRKAGEIESRREGLQASLGKLLNQSNDDGERLASVIRQKILEAKSRWESVASPAQLNQIIGEFVGPSIVHGGWSIIACKPKRKPRAHG
jgi:hypothetical protein